MRGSVFVSCVVLASAGTALAVPPNSPYRDGANHHVGDDSFAAKFGRAPDSRDSEKLRMRTHLQHVRAWLALQPATRPELAARRAELLGFLDEYIAKGITPQNARLPWRTPVFIDEHGAICAVGYLIERSTGRALADRIAADHRYEFLEEIAAALPEVQAWIAASGLTLDELASIQPGYVEPDATTWQRWDLARIENGDYVRVHGDDGDNGVGITTRGKLARKQMEGKWTVRDHEDHVLGSGKLKRGSGAWTSFYPDGKKLAAGRFAGNDPEGRWTLYHQSGNVAAIGTFRGGTRNGRWKFFHDTRAKTPIAIGEFGNGHVTGTWRHFDATGALLATSRTETPSSWRDWNTNSGEGELLRIVPGADGIVHHIHVGTKDQQRYQLDVFARAGDRVYVHEWGYDKAAIYDAAGHRLEKIDSKWQASDCQWSSSRKAIARSGDVARLHELLFRDVYGVYEDLQPCAAPTAVEPARAARIDALLASRELVRAQSPKFVRDLVLGTADTSDLDETEKRRHEDMVRVLQQHMSWYVEWPHIDGLFLAVFPTLPGHVVRNWFDTMDGGPTKPD